ncbi:MAG: carboxypeptidase regulatory-like domain-containing protein [Polyangiaceae bacterium]|nr:carboxypeptidase regulatory-like domain-containing protein [Polyangiaceae bacterium]
MSRLLTATALLAAFTSGCGIPLSELETGPVNSCESSSDCAGNGVCASVMGGKACVSPEADLAGLLLEIRPAATSSYGANATYIIDVAAQGTALQDTAPGGQVRRFDPGLPELSSVSGKLRLSPGAPDCGASAQDGSFPATVLFTPVLPYLGLSVAPYEASLVTETDGSGNLTGYSFRAEVPSGQYDLHVVPEAPPGCTKVPPPIALPAQSISSNTAINIESAEPVKLSGTLMVPQSASVEGWFLEVVESEHGNVISEIQTLQQENPEFALLDLNFDWTYRTGYTPLIRLRPPEGSALPTVHWDLTAVALSGPDSLSLSLSDLNAAPRHVEGQVLDQGGAPVIASVQIQSAAISGDVSSTAKYKLETETDEAGVFAADLPPGKYRVIARPTADASKAIAEEALTVLAGDGCFCGQSITVPERSTLRGGVTGPAGESMISAYVVVTPSLSSTTRYLDKVLALDPLQPREQSMPLGGTGFALPVDPGEFDFSVRPADGSRFPWLVRPRLSVPAADIAPTSDLDPMTIPYPAILQGVVRDPAGASLPGTVVRAWVPVRDPSQAGKVTGLIQIGETLTGQGGDYVLPLPPSISE